MRRQAAVATAHAGTGGRASAGSGGSGSRRRPRRDGPRGRRPIFLLRCWEHDRVAAELLGARRERLGLRTEQHRAFGRHVEQALGALEIGARAVEQDVVPNAREHRQTPDAAHRPLERDDGNDRQARAVARGQLAGREQRRVSFRGAVVRHQDVFIGHLGERAYADLRARATWRPEMRDWSRRARPGSTHASHNEERSTNAYRQTWSRVGTVFRLMVGCLGGRRAVSDASSMWQSHHRDGGEIAHVQRLELAAGANTDRMAAASRSDAGPPGTARA